MRIRQFVLVKGVNMFRYLTGILLWTIVAGEKTTFFLDDIMSFGHYFFF